MKKLISSLRIALAPYCEADEMPMVLKAICCELLGIDEYTYYLKDPVTLTPTQMDTLSLAVHRLQRGEPLQYVLGSAPFGGLTVKVDGSVLIPRPETSQLVRLALALTGGDTFLDVGTGSGCIALALTEGRSGSRVFACDVSTAALATARRNAEAHAKAQQGAATQAPEICFLPADILHILSNDALPADLQGIEVGCIVSNPPYIRACERAFMEPRVLDWEPALALFVPDADPLLFYRALALLGQTPLLRPGGTLCVEIHRDFGFETSTLFHLYGYQDIRIHPDLYGNERFVTCRKG